MRADPAMLGQTKYNRLPGDRYFTIEPWVTQALIDHCPHMPVSGSLIWEPAAGEGHMARVLYANGYRVWSTDIEAADGVASLDFLSVNDIRSAGTGTIISNPPFSIAPQFVRHAVNIGMRNPRGMVAMLLRCDWDTAESRRDLFSDAPFAMKLVLTSRPYWHEDRHASPRFSYSWYIWRCGYEGLPQIMYAPKPKENKRGAASRSTRGIAEKEQAGTGGRQPEGVE